MKDERQATVLRDSGGQLVLNDPVGAEVLIAVRKHNCRALLDTNRDRIEHFKRRIGELGLSSGDVVIVLLNVDDANGAAIADLLMPGHDCQQYRDRGELPVARGLAGRAGIEDALGYFDADAALKLKSKPSCVAVVVVDHGVAEIFDA